MRIKNALVFTGEHTMEKKDLCFEGGVITGESVSGELDASGCYVLPGFIDTHIHGAFGVDFYSSGHSSDPRPAIDELSKRGVTSILMTFACEKYDEYIEDIDNVLGIGDDRVAGIHFEGPFVNPEKKGALDPSCIAAPDTDTARKLYERCRGLLKIMTVAPEIEGAPELIRALCEMGVKVSIGHTNASAEVARAAVDIGASRSTHTYNAMRSLSHRDPGVLGLVLTDERVCCELICDMCHVSPEAVKLAVRAKGCDNITMVSDSSFFAGLPEGEYEMRGKRIIVKGGVSMLENGTINGSASTLADGAKNMFDLGFSPAEIAIMAAVNPARAAGLSDRGELKDGYRADVIVLDREFKVKHVFVKGERIL